MWKHRRVTRHAPRHLFRPRISHLTRNISTKHSSLTPHFAVWYVIVDHMYHPHRSVQDVRMNLRSKSDVAMSWHSEQPLLGFHAVQTFWEGLELEV